MDPHTLTPGILILAAGLTATACGVQGSDALSKDEFIERADAICQATDDELDPVFDQIWADLDQIWADLDESGGTEAELEALMFTRWDEAMDTVAPALQRQVDELRALDPPEADQDHLETMLDDLEAAVHDFDALVDGAVAGDDSAKAALDGDDPMDEVNRQAREYGLEVCGAED